MGAGSVPNSPHPNPLPEGEGTRGNPVFDVDEVRRMVKDGVDRLTEMQCLRRRLGAGSPAGVNTLRPIPRPWWSTGCKPPWKTTWLWCPACWTAALRGSNAIRTSRFGLLKNAAIKDPKPDNLRWKDHADNIDAFVYHGAWSTPASKNAGNARFPLPRPAPNWPSTAWRCSALRWKNRASKKNWP